MMIRRKIKSFRRRCRQHFSTQKIKVFTTTLSTTLFDAFNVGVNRRFDCRKPGGTSLQHFRCERHKTTQVLIDIFTKNFFPTKSLVTKTSSTPPTTQSARTTKRTPPPTPPPRSGQICAELRHAVFSEACLGPLTPNGPELGVFPNPETGSLDVG